LGPCSHCSFKCADVAFRVAQDDSTLFFSGGYAVDLLGLCPASILASRGDVSDRVSYGLPLVFFTWGTAAFAFLPMFFAVACAAYLSLPIGNSVVAIPQREETLL
jgi:hypothetical protein